MHETTILRPRALCEVLADLLRERILRHEIGPGELINEQALTRHYGVSRTPVREALKILHHEGLLTAHAGKGMEVTIVDPGQLDEARALCRLLREHAAVRGLAVDAPPPDSLLARMLDMAEQRVQLAEGQAACRADERAAPQAVEAAPAPAGAGTPLAGDGPTPLPLAAPATPWAGSRAAVAAEAPPPSRVEVHAPARGLGR